MIDIEVEDLIGFRDATRLKLLRRNGQRPHLATLYRWAERGIRGVRLETVQIGGSRRTSRQAIVRFIEHLTTGEPTPRRLRSHRQRAIARAEQELARHRI